MRVLLCLLLLTSLPAAERQLTLIDPAARLPRGFADLTEVRAAALIGQTA